jgi:hypothetical protein
LTWSRTSCQSCGPFQETERGMLSDAPLVSPVRRKHPRVTALDTIARCNSRVHRSPPRLHR